MLKFDFALPLSLEPSLTTCVSFVFVASLSKWQTEVDASIWRAHRVLIHKRTACRHYRLDQDRLQAAERREDLYHEVAMQACRSSRRSLKKTTAWLVTRYLINLPQTTISFPGPSTLSEDPRTWAAASVNPPQSTRRSEARKGKAPKSSPPRRPRGQRHPPARSQTGAGVHRRVVSSAGTHRPRRHSAKDTLRSLWRADRESAVRMLSREASISGTCGMDRTRGMRTARCRSCGRMAGGNLP